MTWADRVVLDHYGGERSWGPPPRWTPPADWRETAGVPALRPMPAPLPRVGQPPTWDPWADVEETRRADAAARTFEAHMRAQAFAKLRKRHARLWREAADLLDAGASLEDLTIVTSPVYPDGRMMTHAQRAAHGAELWAALDREMGQL